VQLIFLSLATLFFWAVMMLSSELKQCGGCL